VLPISVATRNFLFIFLSISSRFYVKKISNNLSEIHEPSTLQILISLRHALLHSGCERPKFAFRTTFCWLYLPKFVLYINFFFYSSNKLHLANCNYTYFYIFHKLFTGMIYFFQLRCSHLGVLRYSKCNRSLVRENIMQTIFTPKYLKLSYISIEI
jgi:hypothetical protein